jgi:hypothetical protein
MPTEYPLLDTAYEIWAAHCDFCTFDKPALPSGVVLILKLRHAVLCFLRSLLVVPAVGLLAVAHLWLVGLYVLWPFAVMAGLVYGGYLYLNYNKPRSVSQHVTPAALAEDPNGE